MSQPSIPETPRVIQPLYQKLSLILLGLVALCFALSVLSPIVIPLLFAMLLGILLDPLVKLLVRWGLHHVVSIAIAVILAMAALGGVGYFIVTQAAHFSETMPEMKKKFGQLTEDAMDWVQQTSNAKPQDLDNAVEKMKSESMEKTGSVVGTTLTTVGTLFAFFFLLPVFTFLTLLYKKLFITFLTKLFPRKDQETLGDVLDETKGIVQSYLIGLLFEAVIVATLNWIGLMAIGVKYALLLAVIGAVLNLIPYIGMIIATLLPMAIAITMQDATAALWVLGLYSAVQFLDNNFIVPLVVASRVELNALVSLVVVMAFGMLWGIPGMFLAIPVTAMLKVIFDRVPSLEPFGYLLGGDDPDKHRSIFRIKKKQEVVSK